jgi:hypothetical protein
MPMLGCLRTPLSRRHKTFNCHPQDRGSATVTGTDVTDGSKTANTSSSVTVNAGSFVKLQVLAPGETAAPARAV